MSALYLLPPHEKLVCIHKHLFSPLCAFFFCTNGNLALVCMCRHFVCPACVIFQETPTCAVTSADGHMHWKSLSALFPACLGVGAVALLTLWLPVYEQFVHGNRGKTRDISVDSPTAQLLSGLHQTAIQIIKRLGKSSSMQGKKNSWFWVSVLFVSYDLKYKQYT